MRTCLVFTLVRGKRILRKMIEFFSNAYYFMVELVYALLYLIFFR